MENISSTKTALKWGVILGIIFMILGILMYFFELWRTPLIIIPFTVFLFLFINLGIGEYKNANESFLKIGQGINIGTLIGAISSIIFGIFNLIYSTFIKSTLDSQIHDFHRDEMVLNGKIAEENINKVVEIGQNTSSPGTLFVFTIFIFVFVGFIFSLIISIFLQKKKPTLN